MNREKIYYYDNDKIEKLENNLNRMYDKYDDLMSRYLILEREKNFNHITKIANAKYFGKKINKRLLNHEYDTLFVFDICNFSSINLEHGYDIGNKVLSDIGKILNFKDNYDGFSGFLGCNRFGIYKSKILIQEEAYNYYIDIKNQIMNVLNEYGDLNIRVVVTPLNCNYNKLNDIYIKSEIMLKKLKERKVDFLYYDKNQQHVEASKDSLALYVIESVNTENYFVVYQEKVDSVTNKVIGLEALARLNHNDRVISPNVFIPILEETIHIIEFGYMIIESVLKNMHIIEEKYGKDIVVSINISPKQFSNQEFKSWLDNISKKYDVNLNQIEFEITENVFVNDMDNCINQLLLLKRNGVRFALDDFGTGYSSLQYLTKLPVDTLKIDKSFIDQVYQEQTKLVVKAIIDVGKASNLNIVAEGVEEKGQVDILNSIGCNIIQGYYYSKPKQLL